MWIDPALLVPHGTAGSAFVQGLARVVGRGRPRHGTHHPRPPLVLKPGMSLVRIRTSVVSARRFTLRAGPSECTDRLGWYRSAGGEDGPGVLAAVGAP
jgi:hypothetical protein